MCLRSILAEGETCWAVGIGVYVGVEASTKIAGDHARAEGWGMSGKPRCVDCHEFKDSCQIDPCMQCTHPLCEWCSLEFEGTCRACSSNEQAAEAT